MNLLIIDSLCDEKSREAIKTIRDKTDADVIETADKNINPCVGCNRCWLVTPGVCSIRDDYEEILRAIVKHDTLLLIGGTKLGFVDYKLKNIVDRFLPLLTMMIKFSGGQERHVPRYKKKLKLGLLYSGEADGGYLNRWMERVAINLSAETLGAYSVECVGEFAI